MPEEDRSVFLFLEGFFIDQSLGIGLVVILEIHQLRVGFRSGAFRAVDLYFIDRHIIPGRRIGFIGIGEDFS